MLRHFKNDVPPTTSASSAQKNLPHSSSIYSSSQRDLPNHPTTSLPNPVNSTKLKQSAPSQLAVSWTKPTSPSSQTFDATGSLISNTLLPNTSLAPVSSFPQLPPTPRLPTVQENSSVDVTYPPSLGDFSMFAGPPFSDYSLKTYIQTYTYTWTSNKFEKNRGENRESLFFVAILTLYRAIYFSLAKKIIGAFFNSY